MNWYSIAWAALIVASLALIFVLCELKVEICRIRAAGRSCAPETLLAESRASRVGTSGLFRDSESAPCVIWSENWLASTARASTSDPTFRVLPVLVLRDHTTDARTSELPLPELAAAGELRD